MTQLEENKLAAGPILGFVGGFVIFVYGAYEIYVGATVESLASLNGLPVGGLWAVVTAGFVGSVMGILVMGFSIGLLMAPDYHTVLGGLMILASVTSLVSVGGGAGVGLILGVLGGTCAIVFGPEDPSYSEPRPPVRDSAGNMPFSPQEPPKVDDPLLRACHSCEEEIPIEATVCPKCGFPTG